MKQKLVFCLKFSVSAILLFVLYSKIDIAETKARFASANILWLVLCFALLTLNTLISSIKWKILLKSDGIEQSTWSLFSSHLIGSFFNLFFPSTIGGDAYRVADIGNQSSNHARTFASILADRLTGFIALTVYALVSTFFVRNYIDNWNWVFIALPSLALFGLLVLCYLLWQQKFLLVFCNLLPSKPNAKVLKIVNPILDSIRIYLSNPGVCFKSFVIAFLFQFNAILAVYSLSSAINLDLPLLPFCFFVPFITLMEMIPISIFGIGLRDTGYLWFMLAMGRTDDVARVDSASLAVLYVGMTILYVAFGGILFVFKKNTKNKIKS